MKTDRKILFQQRFERYYPVLCHIAAGYLADSDDCEDVVQELFISMWNQGRDDMEEKAFLAYLKTATRNNCISFLRRRQRLQTVSTDDESARHLTDTSDTDRPKDYGSLLDTLLEQMPRSEEHTSELQSRQYLVCRLLLEKTKPAPSPLE